MYQAADARYDGMTYNRCGKDIRKWIMCIVEKAD